MFESRGEFSVPIEFSHYANLQEVGSALQTRSQYENRSRSSKQHLSIVSLKKHSEFRGFKKRLVGSTICIDFRTSSLDYARLGITATKRFGKAHERNRFKRQVREAFRRANIPPGIDINVIPRSHAKSASTHLILAEMTSLLEKC